MARKIVGRVLVAPTSEDDGERMHGAINVRGMHRRCRNSETKRNAVNIYKNRIQSLT